MEMMANYSFPREDITDKELVNQMGIPLRQVGSLTFKAPQNLVTHYAQSHSRFILSFDKGMGKTITYLQIMKERGFDKLIILCSQNAMLTQLSHIQRFYPEWQDRLVMVRGSRMQRYAQWHTNKLIYITTPDTLMADMGERAPARGQTQQVSQVPHWVKRASIVNDEFHRKLRTRKSGFYTMMKAMEPEDLILSSGSVAGKGPQDAWAALRLVGGAKVFGSYWGYVATFCEQEETRFGKQITGVKNIEGWRNTVAPHLFHRRKDLIDYPIKTRQALETEFEPWQKKIHDDLVRDLMAILPSGKFVVTANTLAAASKIRQFMVCPKVLDETLGYGAGLQAILDDVQEGELSHWVISTPFRAPVGHIQNFFAQHKFPYSERLMGGDVDGPTDMANRIARWTQRGGPMVQTIKYAESYELPAASNMYMLGYEYDPEANSQAEDRIHRDIRVTPHPVNIYYVKHRDSYDSRVIDDLANNADNVYNLMNRPLSEVFNLFNTKPTK
jgi:hypothetical protein